jgi:hypothetical protein
MQKVNIKSELGVIIYHAETHAKIIKMAKEFDALKKKIFAGLNIVEVSENSTDHKRYNQLLAFFYPRFRTETWKNPMEVV